MAFMKGTNYSGRLRARFGLDFTLVGRRLSTNPEIKLRQGQFISGQTDGYIKFLDDNSLELLVVKEVVSAVNEVQISPAVTGSGPILEATGDDTNIDLNLTPKGTGSVATSSPVAVSAEVEAKSVQLTNTARVATSDGSGTGTIADNTSFVTVTVTTDLNDIIILPTPTPGKVVWLQSGSVAYELRSSAPSSVAINGGTGANAESAVASGDHLTRAVCTSATTWIVTHFAAAGTESAADAAA